MNTETQEEKLERKLQAAWAKTEIENLEVESQLDEDERRRSLTCFEDRRDVDDPDRIREEKKLGIRK